MSSQDFLIRSLEQIANRYLALDLEMANQFEELEGQCLLFDITQPAFKVFVLPQKGRLQLQKNCAFEPDCTVSGSSQGLMKLVRSDNPTEALSNGDIEIKGDSRVAQRFSDILGEIEIDWEELASHVVGDFPAHKMGTALRSLKEWVADSLTATRLNTTEYLQEESRILVTRVEVDHFLEEVDTLRSDLDRAEASLRLLERKMSQASGSDT